MTTIYSLYGLTFECSVDLPGVATSQDAPEFAISTGQPLPSADIPAGRVLLDFATDQPWYTLVDEGGDLHFSVHGVCSFTISSDLTSVVLHPDETMTPGMDQVMITGTLLALQLYLRQIMVLHASAVQIANGAIAFIGHSGSGKTTMATIMCAGGEATVITDDVLRVDFRDHGPVARLGSSELRLRPGVESISSRIDPTNSMTRASADQRSVLRPPGLGQDQVPLKAIVIPQPSRTSLQVEAHRLPPRDALMAVLSYPRLMGWQDSEVISRVFGQVARLVSAVPVLAMQVPWGPPFTEDLAADVRGAVQSAVVG